MAHGALTLKEIYTAISDTDSTKFGARNAGIILFMLSSNLDQEFMANLTINDMIMACSDYLEDPSLNSLLNLDPWKIAPCWKDINRNDRWVFSSPESTFYIFLHLKQRLKDSEINLNEPLFMGDRNGGLQPNTIRDVVTAVDNDSFSFSFTPTSLKKTYLNICKRYFSDNNLLELFTTEINEDNPFYYQSSVEIRQYYQDLIPLLTSRLFDASIKNDGIDEDNVDKIVKEHYYKIFSKTHENYGTHALFRILAIAKDMAINQYEASCFKDNISYLNLIFDVAEMAYLIENSKYHHIVKSAISDKFFYSTLDERVNEIIKIFDELGILNVLKPSEETLRNELMYYAAMNNVDFYALSYDGLIDILNNVLIPMREGIYATKS